MTIEEFKSFYSENKENPEVTSFVQGLAPITLEGVQAFVANDKNAKSWIDSEKDKHYQKSFQSWKDNGNLTKAVDEEVAKRFPTADPKDIELKKLQAKVEQMEKDGTRKEIVNKSLKIFTERKLPVDLIDYLISDSEENTMKNIEKFESIFNSHADLMVNEKIKERLGDGYVPPKDKNKSTSVEDMDMEQYAKYHNEKYKNK